MRIDTLRFVHGRSDPNRTPLDPYKVESLLQEDRPSSVYLVMPSELKLALSQTSRNQIQERTQYQNPETGRVTSLPQTLQSLPEDSRLVVVRARFKILKNLRKAIAGILDTHPTGKVFFLTTDDDLLRKIFSETEGPIDPDSQAWLLRQVFQGRSQAHEETCSWAERFIDLDLTLLITGKTGTGKGLLARAIHDIGARRHEPFILVNCANLSTELFRSELEGHVVGAFTGAVTHRLGAFREAGHGTIFLDEIGLLPLDQQGKLLHALDHGMVIPVGSSAFVPHHARVIAATNLDLELRVRVGAFREDLYWRLNQIQIRTPILQENPDDIELHAQHIWSDLGARNDLPAELLEDLKARPLLGNFRELQNRVRIFYYTHQHDQNQGQDRDEGEDRDRGQHSPYGTRRTG